MFDYKDSIMSHKLFRISSLTASQGCSMWDKPLLAYSEEMTLSLGKLGPKRRGRGPPLMCNSDLLF